MITFTRPSALFAAGLLLLNGCASIEIKPEGNVDRVLTGTVNYSTDGALPAGTVLTVRLLDTSNPGAPAVMIGEQTITNPGAVNPRNPGHL
ncbi:MAG: hypothetical protein EXS39_06370 [Opitutaceae bacterium]|nr:hypothetical protein [Opitutaceae bacterium]